MEASGGSSDGAGASGAPVEAGNAQPQQVQQPVQPVQTAGPSAAASSSSSSAMQPSSSNAARQPRSATGAAPSASGSSSSSSDHTLSSIDSLVASVVHIANTPDRALQYKLVKESLWPALYHLETKGTDAGVTGPMVLTSAMQGGKDPLLVLLEQPNKTAGGLGFLWILLARCQAENPDPTLIMHCVDAFAKYIQADQVRLVPNKLHLLSLWVNHICRPAPGRAITPIAAMLCALVPPGPTSYLTQLHPQLLLAALKANDYIYVNRLLEVVSDVCIEIDAKAFQLTYQDVMKWFLYAGTIHAIHGRYEKAVDALEAAVTFPSRAGSTSLLQIDALKRLYLVQLLQDGKTSSLPKYTSVGVYPAYRSLYSNNYIAFAHQYSDALKSTSGVEPVKKIYALVSDPAVRQVFEADGNLGLVSRCLQELPKKRIVKLGEVFKTISLQEVVQRLGFAQPMGSQPSAAEGGSATGVTQQALQAAMQLVEQLVGELVASGQVRFVGAFSSSATESGTDPSTYIEFLTPSSSTIAHSAQLASAHALLAQTSYRTKHLDATISGSRDFLTKAYNAASVNGGGNRFGGFGDPMGGGMEEELLGAGGMSGGGEFWED